MSLNIQPIQPLQSPDSRPTPGPAPMPTENEHALGEMFGLLTLGPVDDGRHRLMAAMEKLAQTDDTSDADAS